MGVGEELIHVHLQHLWFHLRSASSREHLYAQVSPPGGMSWVLVPLVLCLDYFQSVFYFDLLWIWDCVSQLGLALKDEGKGRVA